MQSLLTKHKLKFFQQTRNQVFMHACMQPTPTESIVTCRCQILHFTLFSKLRNMHEQLPFVGNLPRKYLYIVLIGQHRVHCLHTLPTYLTRTQCDGIKNVLRWNESFNAQWWEWNPAIRQGRLLSAGFSGSFRISLPYCWHGARTVQWTKIIDYHQIKISFIQNLDSVVVFKSKYHHLRYTNGC